MWALKLLGLIAMLAFTAWLMRVIGGWRFGNPAGYDFDDEPEEQEELPEPIYGHPVMSHILFYGQAGLGKTSFARVVSNELKKIYGHEVQFHEYIAGNITNPEMVRSIVSKLQYGDVLFIDEIHSLDLSIEELFYAVLQESRFFDKGVATELPPCTIMAATTNAGKLSKPLRDRFPLNIELEPMGIEDLVNIANDQDDGVPEPSDFDTYRGQEDVKPLITIHMVALLKDEHYPVSDNVKHLVAKRALGVPRVMKQLLKHIVAFQKADGKQVTTDVAEELMTLVGIDRNGLHKADRRVIRVLLERGNQPLGLKALASASNISADDLEHMVEPRLQHCGFLMKTPRGRCLAEAALKEYAL